MKNLLVVSLLFSFSITYAQNFNFFPGLNIESLKGKKLRVKELDQSSHESGYENFYKDADFKKRYSPTKADLYSSYKSLVNREFVLTEIILPKTQLDRHTLILKDNSGETLYYKYDPSFSYYWKFEIVQDGTLPNDFYCNGIQLNYDKFTGDSVFYTNSVEAFTIFYTNQTITLKHTAGAEKPYTGAKGFYLILQDGTIIQKPDENVSSEVSNSRYGSPFTISVMVTLTEKDIMQIMNSPITDSKIYIYERKINPILSVEISNYLKCLYKRIK